VAPHVSGQEYDPPTAVRALVSRISAVDRGSFADVRRPDAAEVLPTDDLREIAVMSEAVRTDEARLREAVTVARAHGRSWNRIAVALGVSRQAARQRFRRQDPQLTSPYALASPSPGAESSAGSQ
jgi:hypothetical protein